MDTLFLSEQRCRCGKLLLKGIFFDGILEIKCKKCGAMNKIGSIKLADDDTHYLLIVDERGIIANVSISACKILGYTHEELIGHKYIKISPDIPIEIHQKFLYPDSILNDDNYFKIDTFHQSKNGNKIPVITTVQLYKPSCKEKFLLISVEVKSNNSGEIAINNKENASFSDNLCDCYFDIDKSGVFEEISSGAEKLFSISQDKLIGKKYFDYISDGNKIENQRVFDHFMPLARPFRIVLDVIKNNDNIKTNCEMYFTPNYNTVGKLIGYRILMWEINKPSSGSSVLKFILIPIAAACTDSVLNIFTIS